MLRAKVDQQKQKAFDLNQDAAQYAILKHEVEGTQDLYQTLQLKLKQAGVVAGLASANIAVVESGQVAAEPVDPRPGLDLLLGLGGGLGLGMLSAAGLEALDNSIRTGEEAERDSALPTLAVIPKITVDDSRGRARDFPEAAPELLLIACQKPSSSAAESFRNLRTALQLRPGGEPPKTIVVTSSSPSEGKTLTAISCAVVLAQQGAKVLLVDADLRQPSIHAAFKVGREPGLSSILTANSAAKQVITPSKVFANLSILPAGPACAYPAEMLASSGMLEQLARWRTQYDHIVLDTPPVCMFTDAVVLGSRADAVVLVVRAGVTTGYAVRHTRDLLQRANVDIAGLVLNGADARYERSYYRAYGYRFGGKNGRRFDS
jgi:capsular exopolysaccharide synthesis family protein